MRRALFVGLVAGCALMRPAGAFAQSEFIDWLESPSAPGPFHGHFRSVNSRALCTVSDDGKQRIDWWCGNDTRPNIKTVLTADVAWPDSDSNVRFADSTAEVQNTLPVRATRVLATYQYRFH